MDAKDGSKEEQQKALFPRIEEEILSYWEKERIFEKVLERTKKAKPFVFYEGPPYANGRPGIHHVLARAYKDVILRFKTMQGFFVPRKAGWDTHGLPVEMEVEKKLNVHSKKEIEALGIDSFVETARNSVFEYKKDHEKMTKRMGYWLDLKNAYVTMTNEYIAGLWRVFGEIAKNGFVYRDYKVLPWCPRCETSLSSHEVAQGYQKVKDISLYVKFQITKSKFQKNSKLSAKGGSASGGKIQKDVPIYLLAWTTTPWTLPGNVALAVGKNIRYVKVKSKDKDEVYILAKNLLPKVFPHFDGIELGFMNGKDLMGLKYEPLYPSKTYSLTSNTYTVVSADFVTTDDGTGIVHIAPAFGVDDQKAGKKNNLPTLVTVGEDGKMNTPGYPWDGESFTEANILILKDLAGRNLLFKKESYEHDYPHCWRCKSKLIYYAKDSWFLKTTAVKVAMQKENAGVHWHPDFVGENRFGDWLRENVDWAISRERYWGMPLPIWKCETCRSYEFVSSLDDLDARALSDKTEIYVMRHGEAAHNVKGIVGPPIPKLDKGSKLTEKGKQDVRKAAQTLQRKIDVIVASPLHRAQETANIVAKELKNVRVETHANLHDIHIGIYAGKKISEVDTLLPDEKRFENAFPEGESNRDARARILKALFDIHSRFQGKRILIVSHGDPLWLLYAALEGKKEKEYKTSWYPRTAEVKKFRIHNWPYSMTTGELDFHRPYIDGIHLQCKKCKGEMERIKDVADVWFDSGCMPFAQNPGFLAQMQKSKIKIQNIGKIIPYPADYICEGMDQTRGWFYTLLAVSSLLKIPVPYRNVLTVGLVLDQKGEKMSKSRGNIVEPFSLFETYGADAVRWYFYTINQPWDEKLFAEADIQGVSRRFLMIFWNVFQYWRGVNQKSGIRNQESNPKLIINQWLLARLQDVVNRAVNYLEEYGVVSAARLLEEFVVEDISRWYIRRIRDVMKLGKEIDKKETSVVLGSVIQKTAVMLAPFIPFLAEKIWKEIGNMKSIHEEKWQTKNQELRIRNQELLKDMEEVRRIVSLALEARSKAEIKVRQPLQELRIKNQESRIKDNKDLQELIIGEVNVKKIIFGAKIKEEAELDTVITPELKQEGICRDLVRAIQDARKTAGFAQKDKIVLIIGADEKGKKIIEKFKKEIAQGVNAKEIKIGELAHALFMRISIQIEDYYFEIGFKK